jgi:hypothetical protein
VATSRAYLGWKTLESVDWRAPTILHASSRDLRGVVDVFQLGSN